MGTTRLRTHPLPSGYMQTTHMNTTKSGLCVAQISNASPVTTATAIPSRSRSSGFRPETEAATLLWRGTVQVETMLRSC